MKYYQVCIVGAGLAGLTAAYYLLKEGIRKIVIVEASNRAGGLLKSEKVGNYIFDAGGSHIIFSRSIRVLNEIINILSEDLIAHRRNTKVHYKGLFVKYPFENGLGQLPATERYECLKNLVDTYIKRIKGELQEPENFLEWILYVFGKSIAEKYLIPYNEKLWKVDLREITLEWVGGRVPNPPIDDVIKAAVGIEVEGYQHQLFFYYPVSGIESLAKSLVSTIIKLGAEVKYFSPALTTRIHEKRGNTLKIIELPEDEIVCSCVVYTAPLNNTKFFKYVASPEVAQAVGRLRSIPVSVIGLGLRRPVPPIHWIYFPDKDLIFHRAAVLSNYSPLTAPAGSSTLIAEVSFHNVESMRSVNNNDLIRRVIDGFESIGLVKSAADVEVAHVWKWDHAYVLYDRLRKALLPRVKAELMKAGIFLHGRFGSWEYLNMDAVFMKSKELAIQIKKYLLAQLHSR